MWHWRQISVFILANAAGLPCRETELCRLEFLFSVVLSDAIIAETCFCVRMCLRVCVSLCMQADIDVMCLVTGNFRQFVVWHWVVLTCGDYSTCFVIGIQKVSCVCLCYEVSLPRSLILNQHRNTGLKAGSLLSRWNWCTSQSSFFWYASVGLVISVAAVLCKVKHAV